MNLNRAEARELIHDLLKRTTSIRETIMMVAPPFVHLWNLSEILRGSKIHLGAQNLFWEEKGAYTGEISAPLLKDSGCEYVIVGHSERRQYFKETDQDVNRKVNAALKQGLSPVVCVGETLEQREKGITLAIVEKQIRDGLQAFSSEQAPQWSIAYEPVWAIGTGRAATPGDAIEVHSLIRRVLSEMFGKNIAQKTLILYGGSVTAENIESFIREPEIDGALVGGASLKSDSFSLIIEAAEQQRLSS